MIERCCPPFANILPSSEDHEAARLAALRLLAREPAVSQRDVSRALGVSVGKAHYLLHALLDRGWVKAQNFRRSDRKMAFAYVLTPSGVREKLRLTRDFLQRKEREFEQMRATIETLRRELAAESAARSQRQRAKEFGGSD